MKSDAHFYAVLAFARGLGFKKEIAHQIAYASQFVDDARVDQIVLNREPDNSEYDIIEDKPAFFGMSTCHCYLKVKSFNYNAMINNTSAFHFVPAGEGKSFVKKMRCKKDNPVINKILREAILEEDPVILGVTLHPYADSFSHQGFSGLMSRVNDIKNIKLYSNYYKVLPFKFVILIQKILRNSYDRYLDKFMPAYGHGQALSYPDLPFLKWTYEYDYSDEFLEDYRSSELINNPARYRLAFEKIKSVLSRYLINYPQYKDHSVKFKNFEDLFELLTQRHGNIRRRKNWIKALVNLDLFDRNDPILKYDEFAWLKLAFKDFKKKKFRKRIINFAVIEDNFAQSCWYRFYKAVKWYKERFFKYCFIEGIEIQT